MSFRAQRSGVEESLGKRRMGSDASERPHGETPVEQTPRHVAARAAERPGDDGKAGLSHPLWLRHRGGRAAGLGEDVPRAVGVLAQLAAEPLHIGADAPPLAGKGLRPQPLRCGKSAPMGESAGTPRRDGAGILGVGPWNSRSVSGCCWATPLPAVETGASLTGHYPGASGPGLWVIARLEAAHVG